jgi:hypothetical protein
VRSPGSSVRPEVNIDGTVGRVLVEQVGVVDAALLTVLGLNRPAATSLAGTPASESVPQRHVVLGYLT